MDTPDLHIDRGIRFLSRHSAQEALASFSHALAICPVSDRQTLYRVLFYLGVTLNRLGFRDSAIKSWLASQKITKNGYAQKMLQRFANAYGMERQTCPDLDDWQAFYSLHLSRYLVSTQRKGFSSLAERDMIRDLIADSWIDLKRTGILSGKNEEEKRQIFQVVEIIFPSTAGSSGSSVIFVDFFRQKAILPGDRCPCGSGLSFLSCCGRIKGEEELLTGHF